MPLRQLVQTAAQAGLTLTLPDGLGAAAALRLETRLVAADLPAPSAERGAAA